MMLNNKKNKKYVVSICILVVVLTAVCIGVFGLKGNKDDQKLVVENETISEEQSNEFLESSESDEEDIQVLSDYYEIETKYCKLYFPEVWKENIEIVDKEEMGYKVGFYGRIDNKEAQLLFEVCFNSDDGELLGYLELEENIVNISIDINDIVFDDSWEEEEMNQIYTMQEEVNFVIDTLKMNENYVIPN